MPVRQVGGVRHIGKLREMTLEHPLIGETAERLTPMRQLVGDEPPAVERQHSLGRVKVLKEVAGNVMPLAKMEIGPPEYLPAAALDRVGHRRPGTIENSGGELGPEEIQADRQVLLLKDRGEIRSALIFVRTVESIVRSTHQ